MVKYLSDSISRLKELLNGMLKNPEIWTKPDETPEAVQSKITGLEVVSKTLEDAQENLTLTQVNARRAQADAAKFADDLENSAIAYHKSDQVKLSVYGIELRKPRTKRTSPTSTIYAKLQDDTDGQGFIVSTIADPNADQYEWQKGMAADASKTDVIPDMKLFKSTTKLTFVDDDVQKGVRYFYRVRAINTAGEGPWSEAVSRVQ